MDYQYIRKDMHKGMAVKHMRIYFKIFLEDTGREAYICANDIVSVENGDVRCLCIHLKDGKAYFTKSMYYVPEEVVDGQSLIRLENNNMRKVVAPEIIAYVKQCNGKVRLRLIEEYLSTRAFNCLIRGGCSRIDWVIWAIEDMRMLKWRGMGRRTVQEVIDLFLQMGLIERENDQAYEPFEGYIRAIDLIDKNDEKDDAVVAATMEEVY